MTQGKPCKYCGEIKTPRALCKSKKCVEARTCIDCGLHLRLGPSIGPRCYSCHRKYKQSYERLYHNREIGTGKPTNSRPTIKLNPRIKNYEGRCKSCPSLNTWGRCGGVTSGPQQMLPAIAVRLSGNCPRRRGLRSELDAWCNRRNNADLPPLDGHRLVVGKQGSYVDECKIFN
jgi:hypothetical protein